MHAYAYICMHIHTYACICICIHMQIYAYICISPLPRTQAWTQCLLWLLALTWSCLVFISFAGWGGGHEPWTLGHIQVARVPRIIHFMFRKLIEKAYEKHLKGF